MGNVISTGWTVVDVDGVEVGTISAIVPDPQNDESTDDEVMVVKTSLFGDNAQLRAPMTAIRAVMKGRLLLTQPHAKFVELGWVERTPSAERAHRSPQSDGQATRRSLGSLAPEGSAS